MLNQKAVLDVLYGDEDYEKVYFVTSFGAFVYVWLMAPKFIYPIPQRLYKNLVPSNLRQQLATTRK